MAPDATVRPTNGLFLPDNVSKFTNDNVNIGCLTGPATGPGAAGGGGGTGEPHKLDRRHTFPNGNAILQQQQPRQQPEIDFATMDVNDPQWLERVLSGHSTSPELDPALTLFDIKEDETIGSGVGSVCPSAIFPKESLMFHGNGSSGVVTKPYVFPGAEPEATTTPSQTNGVLPMAVDPPQNATFPLITGMGPTSVSELGNKNTTAPATQKGKANANTNGVTKDTNKMTTSDAPEPEPVQLSPQYKLAEEGSELVIKAVSNFLDRSGFATHPEWWEFYAEWAEFYNEWKSVRETTFKFWDHEMFNDIFWLASQLQKCRGNNHRAAEARYLPLTKKSWNQLCFVIYDTTREMFRDLIVGPAGGGNSRQQGQRQQQERHSLPSNVPGGPMDLSSDFSLFGSSLQQQQQQMRHSM